MIALKQVPLPAANRGHARISVNAAAVTSGDARIRSAMAPAGMSVGLRLAFGIRRPRQPVLGMFFSGTLEEAVAGMEPGTRVFGNTGMAMGAHAQHLTIASDRIVAIPDDLELDDAEAAALPFGGLTAADFLIGKARIAQGAKVLVNGATGEVGCAALQIASNFGAIVTAVCRTENHEFARELGASRVHDYREGIPRGQWDIVMDIAGTLPWRRASELVAPGGVHLPVTASLHQMLGAALFPRRAEGRRISGTTSSDGPAALLRLRSLFADGVLKPVVGARFPFSRIVDAHVLVDTGHKRGGVVVTMQRA
ncbi:NAD(P)-dependent alcohol dehydrogenase [Altererythrobacter sp. Z27]|uniref:NAD(P)-dependent alcohol dehydrogenase n=1 Tax=Altererythrobacter sp. Z27 TaxID=3461147 RepID=UPI004043FCBD